MRINSVTASGIIPSDFQNAKDAVVNTVTSSAVLMDMVRRAMLSAKNMTHTC